MPAALVSAEHLTVTKIAIKAACPIGMVSEASELLLTIAFHGTAGPPGHGAHQMAS